jgi:hypothetical protein
MRTHGTAAAWRKNNAIFFGVIPCYVYQKETPSKTIFGVSPVGNPDEGGLERCTSGYCLFEIRILA